jgi:2-dehydro-3-deoxyphosphogluconate aldolase/(4S)-4-hydroxy-2-oxoglutarate aldolase
MNDSVLDRIAAHGLVPVLEIPSADVAAPLADALISGGLPCAEVTFRTASAAEAIASMAARHPEMLVGAGTVLTAEQVDIALQAGARFIVSPGIDRAVVDRCLARGVAVLPGVLTPTEAQTAVGCGLSVVKVFPVEAAGGPAYLRALAAPFPGLRFVPSGGVTPDNIAGYLALPPVVAVGGSWMASAALLQARDFAEIASRVRSAVRLVEGLRSEGRPAPAVRGGAGG